MSKQLIMNNVVTRDTMRNIQSKTLHELEDILARSFGPNGSNACIKKENALSRYTKDGHTIIGSIQYNGIIEQSIKDDIESITRYIVKTVGDGTTSAVILAATIFDHIIKFEDQYQPVEIVTALENVVSVIKKDILATAKDLTIDDVYDIAMISTNGNTFVADLLKNIYTEYGNTVFIDVSPSTGKDTVIKSYNGMTLNSGYCDSCYVTNSANNTSEVDKPEVYFFEDPIDTRELGVYFDAIVSKNMIHPVNSGDYSSIVPTVIFAPKISRDMSSTMDSLVQTMTAMPVNNRLPICIITDYHEVDQLADLAQMCGSRMIHKYIDPKMYQADVEAGRAPTPENIFNWAGSCDRVVAYSDKTTFIRPAKMYNEDGSYSTQYDNLLQFLKTEIAKKTEDGENIRDIGTLKRRLHSLESNMVELFVGGITQADRDALRDLVEDAVLNIRSAANNGVGFGANMSAAMAVFSESCKHTPDDSLEGKMYTALEIAYTDLVDVLYNGTDMWDKENYSTSFINAVSMASNGSVYNIRTKKWEHNVKTSIMSDVTILDTVTRIVGIMATCNQFILPTAMHNIYEEPVDHGSDK